MSFFASSSTTTSVASPPTKAQLSGLTAVPSGLRVPRDMGARYAAPSKNRRLVGSRKGLPGGSRLNPSSSLRDSINFTRRYSRAIGNDVAQPWTRPVRDATEVTMTLYANPAALMASSTTVPVYAASDFSLSSLPTVSALTSVFDQYRINFIEVLIVPNMTETTVASQGPGILASAVDLDDANAPSNYSDVSNHEGSLQSSGTMNHYHRWEPQYAVATYSGAFTSYSTARGWIDCGSPGVKHFGLKAYITTASAVTTFSLLARYNVSFRGLH